MIPDVDEAERFLTTLCLELTACGWDQPNLLVPVHAGAAGELDTPMFPVHIEGPPSDWMNRTAVNMAWNPHPELQVLFASVGTPNFAGWLATTESYGWAGTPEQAAALPPGKRFGDHPDGYECRDLVYVDAGDTIHHVTQVRGQQPVYTRAGLNGVAKIDGGLIPGLRLITIAAASRMPAGTHRMPALVAADTSRPVNIRRELERMPRIPPPDSPPGHTCNTTTTQAGCAACIATGAYVPAPPSMSDSPTR